MSQSRYDVLFEPVQLGPVTAPNRFYQVPHCTGMGYRHPNTEAQHRGVKAEGGWGVVSTQETEIHPSSDITPANESRLWSEQDIPTLQKMTSAVHEHGSLAAVQLVHNGLHTSNRYSRRTPLAPSHAIVDSDDPVQAKGMSKGDIKLFRQWHIDAALRAKKAGFDIVYVYAGHDMTLLQHFLLSRHNHRTDEYGGSFENRLRLFREVIADTKEAVGDTCAVAVRLAIDELIGDKGLRHDIEGKDIIEALAEEPDLWDVNLSDWANDSQSSRFSEEGFQDKYTRFVKSVTTKPVVGVGRYTSPDTMLNLVNKGLLDFIGAARPSIADPFLPNKIKEGRSDEIRECIGCNICVSGDFMCVPMRCTQNPTVGEEWRRSWHPEIISNSTVPNPTLIVGGGSAGLEAALVLAKRGTQVTLAESRGQWGGRVTLESSLPGLAKWARVRDWRLGQLQQKDNVDMYLGSALTAQDVLSYGIANVVIATGANWRTDGTGRVHRKPLHFLDKNRVISPDFLMQNGVNSLVDDPIIIFDDDRFYLGSVLAEWVANTGRKTTFVTPSATVASWSENTLEQSRIQKRLIDLNIDIIPLHQLANMDSTSLTLSCVYSGKLRKIECGTLIPVTSRLPNNTLWHDLQNEQAQWKDSGIATVNQIGDCLVPGLIAAATYSGHELGRTLNEVKSETLREDFTP